MFGEENVFHGVAPKLIIKFEFVDTDDMSLLSNIKQSMLTIWPKLNRRNEQSVTNIDRPHQWF